jgi:hypothetical protein
MSRQPLFCLLAFSILALTATGQDHQTNKKTLSRHLREVFDVKKSDWKVKDGAYSVLNDAGSAVVKGFYTNGKKSGVWNFYDNNGKMVQQFDFDRDSLLLQVKDSMSIVHEDYQIPQGVDDSNKLRPPYKIGGAEYGFYLLYDDRDIPQAIKNNTGNAEMTYVLTIDEHGRLESYMVLFAGGSVEDMVVRHSVKGLPPEALEYSSAMVDGIAVRSKISYTIPLTINHTDVPGENYHPNH